MITTIRDAKLLLTTSLDGDVIIAEVERNHHADPKKEYFISRATLEANLKNEKFVDVSEQVSHSGKVWMQNPYKM